MKRIFLALCVLAAMSSCGTQSSSQKQIATVKVDTVRFYGQSPISNYSGRVRAGEDINLAFRVSGTILRTAVSDGQFVKKGQILVEMDPRDYAIQLSATEAEYKQFRGEAERVIELYERGSISTSDYEKAVYGLEQITAKYQAHQNALADTRLVAPFDGYVGEYKYQAGETVAAGYPVVSFYNDRAPEIELYVPREEYDRREDFADITTTVGEAVVPLSLISISPKANLNQLYTLLVKVDASSAVQPAVGSIATVSITYNQGEDGELVVPTTAIFRREGSSYVWVYDGAKVSSRRVEPKAVYKDGLVRVEGDLRAGEIVVSGGVRSLEENQAVRALAPKSSTNIGGLL